jgi:hypothetical protein
MASLVSVYGQAIPNSGSACGTGHCAAFGEGQFDWGFGYSSRAIKSQPLACDATSEAQRFYNPCTDPGTYLSNASACAARTVETWDDATIPDAHTVNYVDVNFYAGPPHQLWNTNWDLRGDVNVGWAKAYPITNIPTRRGERVVYGSDFHPNPPSSSVLFGDCHGCPPA